MIVKIENLCEFKGDGSLRRREFWKPEVRVLGSEVAFEEGNIVYSICVVMRGSLWLDGVFVAKWAKEDPRSFATCLRSSPYYGELCVVLLSASPKYLENLEEIYRALYRPLVVFHKRGEGLYEVVNSAGLTSGELHSLLKVCSGPRGPEALKLAEMLIPTVKELALAWKALNSS